MLYGVIIFLCKSLNACSMNSVTFSLIECHRILICKTEATTVHIDFEVAMHTVLRQLPSSATDFTWATHVGGGSKIQLLVAVTNFNCLNCMYP